MTYLLCIKKITEKVPSIVKQGKTNVSTISQKSMNITTKAFEEMTRIAAYSERASVSSFVYVIFTVDS